MTTSPNKFLPEWCRDPLVYYSTWIAWLCREDESWYGEELMLNKPHARFSELPLEAQALLAARALESMPTGFATFNNVEIAKLVSRLAEERGMYEISSGLISTDTRARMIAAVPNVLELLVSRTGPTIEAALDERNPCASQLYMVWDCSIGSRIEQFDWKLPQRLMHAQIQSNHLGSVRSGLHGIGHRAWRILGSGRPALFDWHEEVKRHVFDRDLPQVLKDYAVRVLARDVQ